MKNVLTGFFSHAPMSMRRGDRMTTTGDAYARCRTGNTAGRGSISGWTSCPLCHPSPSSSEPCLKTAQPLTKKSMKLFSHGRGLSTHLHAVHTPWNPGKAEIKRRERVIHMNKRIENEGQHISRNKRRKLDHDCVPGPDTGQDIIYESKGKWEPSDEEIKQWNERVMEIVATVESDAKKGSAGRSEDGDNTDDGAVGNGRNRSGNVCHAYRESIPPFLAAAAEGNLRALKECVEHDNLQSLEPEWIAHVTMLLSLRDRNGSTAEHWAAGGGHLECLSYLLSLRDIVYKVPNSTQSNVSEEMPQYASRKLGRRRDGKTPLHYAARNGHNEIIDLLLNRYDAPSVNVCTGEGTTPLHIACYGGHSLTVKHLVQKHHANVFAINDWKCSAAHWAAMSLCNDGNERLIELCEFIKISGVDFGMRQKQGHTPLHKAAARTNRHVIKWLSMPSLFSDDERKSMGGKDNGGNFPSDIWMSSGGEMEFGLWMKNIGW